MAKDKKETKKLGPSGWIEIFVFVLTALDLTFLLLGIFNVVRPECLTRDAFSYIVAFVLLGVCLLLFIALMLTEKLGKFSLPGWLKCVLYVGFFVFSNIYYFFGLFDYTITLIFFYAYLGFVLSVLSLSIFYNLQKTEAGIIKTNSSFVSFFTFCSTLAIGTIIELVVCSIKILAGTTALPATAFIVSICSMMIVSLIMAVAYYISLEKSKKFINLCLIKFQK